MHPIFPVLLIFFCFSSSAYATNTTTPKTIVTITAQAEGQFANDESVIRFHVSARGHQQAALRRQVDTITQAISQRLAREKGLQLTTSNRRMRIMRHYDQRHQTQVDDGWQLIQSSKVITRNLTAIPVWLEAIEQAGAQLDGISLRLSGTSRDRANSLLLQQAITRFQNKAATITRALGSNKFTITRFQTTSTPPPSPRPMMEMATMALKTSSPTIDRGFSKLRINVSGTLQLTPHAISVSDKAQ